MIIRIKYFGDIRIKKLKAGDWVDLAASKDVFIPEGTMRLVPLGVAMELPQGYEAHIQPRSSTYKQWGILQTNSVGIIDNSYKGDNDEWMMPCYCINPMNEMYGEKGTWIRKGDRICQFRIMENQPEFEFEVVESLGNEDRSGFGSTGRN